MGPTSWQVREGIGFTTLLAAVGALGHLHLEPSWWVIRLLVFAVLLPCASVCALRLGSLSRRRTNKRLERVLAWFCDGRSASLGLVALFVALCIVGALLPREASAFSFLGQLESQANLFLLTVTICLFWPAVSARRLRGQRVSRRSLILNLLILSVVVQGPLHAARMYAARDGTVFGLSLLSSILAFMTTCTLASFFSWFLTEDAVRATGLPRRTDPAPASDASSIGLAVSGGGIRAAVIANGVFSELRPSRWWSRLSYVSAVSGGSWALANLLRAEATVRSVGDSRAGEVARAATKALKRGRDYIRRGTSAEWLVRPLLVATVNSALQLTSLLLGVLLLVAFGLYLDWLTVPPDRTIGLGRMLGMMKDQAHRATFYQHAPMLESLDTLVAVAVVVGVFGLFTLAVAATLVALVRTRLVSAATGVTAERDASLLAGFGALLVLFTAAPILAARSLSLVLGLALVGSVGWAYVRDWRVKGLGVLSLIAAVAGAVVLLFEKSELISTLRKTVDDAARSAMTEVIDVVAAMKWGVLLVVDSTGQPWPREEAPGLALLVCMGVIGLGYFLTSLVIRLETIGLSSVWRDWVNSFSATRAQDLAWPEPEQRPTPIINMAVNAPGERYKVAHFEADPSFVGGPSVGYAPQGATGAPRLSLLDAITVSSAALNSQAGRYVSSWLRPVLSILSLKLGRWLPHPSTTKPLPALSLHYMNRELIGWNSLGDAHLFLSDGGHFENLGAYALLLRGVSTIVMVDAAADPKYEFSDLSRFIELARYRGYRFEGLDLSQFVPKEHEARGLRLPDTVVGVGALVLESAAKMTRDRNRQRDLPRKVTVIYAKLGLVEALSPTTYAYARQNADFPQQATSDQFFDEAQFEAYHEIGTNLGKAIDARLGETAPAS
ncbi:MAG: hypothetical protein GQE15_28530 [Archangiaceae bacterium]|nr:hypothetical protein [Archangiaceae bacterium]